MGIYLIGVGVVGQEIVETHVAAQVPICVVDQSESALEQSVSKLGLTADQFKRTSLDDGRLPAIEVSGRQETVGPSIVIESIAEKMTVKQSFLEDAERIFGDQAILCSNTSTLRIDRLADDLARPETFLRVSFLHAGKTAAGG